MVIKPSVFTENVDSSFPLTQPFSTVAMKSSNYILLSVKHRKEKIHQTQQKQI